MRAFIITSPLGNRKWWADNADHAVEQHISAFGEDDPDEKILNVQMTDEKWRTEK